MSRLASLWILPLALSSCTFDAGPYPSGAGGDSQSSTSASTTTSTFGAGGQAGDTPSGGTMTTTSEAGAPATGGQGTGGQAGDCPPSGFGPQAQPYPTDVGGQLAWVHDDGFTSGFFHTFDALQVGGPADIPRKVHVFLPPDYDATCAGYPVVYMNDGDTTFWPGGVGNKSWNVAQSLETLYSTGAVPHVLVVAIVPLHREIEYTHTFWAQGHDCCGATAYVDYVADKVKPFIDAHYRTQPAREHTAILGSSHGGLISFLAAGLRPDAFGMAGCLSSSFWAGLDGIQGGQLPGGPLATSLLLDLTKQTLSDPALRPRLWIDWGLVRTGGFHNAVIEAAATTRGIEMVSLLQQSYGYVDGDTLRSLEDPSGEHDENSWAKRFPEVMKALFPAN